MEVYFKNLTSDEVSTEQLVEDVMVLVNQTEDLVNRSGLSLDEKNQAELRATLARVKGRCQQLKEQALAGARQTDQLIRRHPYPSLFIALGLGVLAGLLVSRKSGD